MPAGTSCSEIAATIDVLPTFAELAGAAVCGIVCALLTAAPAQSWYVGDAGRDIEAGRAAGCVTVGALYGYLHPEDPPESWQADLTIDTPEQLLDLINDDSDAS